MEYKSLNWEVSELQAIPEKFLNFTFCMYHKKIIPLQVYAYSWAAEYIKASSGNYTS